MNNSPRGAVWLAFILLALGCQDKNPAEIDLTGPMLSVQGVLVAPGDHVSLQATVKNKNGEILDDIKVIYNSSQPKIIEVSPEGVLWCKKRGSVDVRMVAEQVGIVFPVQCVDPRVIEFEARINAKTSPAALKIMKETFDEMLIRKIPN